MDASQSGLLLFTISVTAVIFFVFQLLLDFPQGVLAHDDHTQWRFAALIAVFLGLICEKPPQMLRGVFKYLRLEGNARQQTEWRIQASKYYQALFMAVGIVGVPYQLWNRDPQSTWTAIIRASQPLLYTSSVGLIDPLNFKMLLLHRRTCYVMVVVFTIVTFEQRRAGELPGVQWPGAVVLPMMGAVLHNSVNRCLAECFVLNAIWFADAAQPSNFLRILSVCVTCLAASVVFLKLVFLHMNLAEDLKNEQLSRGAACSLNLSCHAVAEDGFNPENLCQ